MRDAETGNSKGFAFVNFASFEASDSAIEAMNGQFLCNRAITVSYAFKKDTKVCSFSSCFFFFGLSAFYIGRSWRGLSQCYVSGFLYTMEKITLAI